MNLHTTHSAVLPYLLFLFLSSSTGSGPLQYYVSLSQSQQPKSVTTFVKYVLANMTGTATSLNQSQCQNPTDIPGESKDVRLWKHQSCQNLVCFRFSVCPVVFQCDGENPLRLHRKISQMQKHGLKTGVSVYYVYYVNLLNYENFRNRNFFWINMVKC